MDRIRIPKSKKNEQIPSAALERMPAPDEETFNAWLAEAVPNLRTFAMSLTDQPTDAEDLLQETYLRASSSRDKFHYGNRNSLDAWLTTIMKNIVRDEAVRRKRHVEINELTSRQPSMIVSPNQEEGLYAQQYGDKLRHLPKDLREAFEQVQLDGKTPADVATRLGVSDSVIQHRVAQAQEILARELGLAIPPKATMTNPEDLLSDKEYHRIISGLPRKQQETYRMIRIERRSYKEVADLLGATIKTVASNYRKARRAIAREMGVDPDSIRKDPLNVAYDADPKAFERFMEALQPRQKLAVQLLVIQGRSKEEVSQMPEFPHKYDVARALGYARRRLRLYRGFR